MYIPFGGPPILTSISLATAKYSGQDEGKHTSINTPVMQFERSLLAITYYREEKTKPDKTAK